MDPLATPKLTIVDKATQQTSSLCCTNSKLVIYDATGIPKVTVPFDKILWCEVGSDDSISLSLALLYPRRRRTTLLSISGIFEAANREQAVEFTSFVMESAYKDLPRQRRFKILVNPKGGTGKALQLFEHELKGLFEAAHCRVDVVVTEYSRHGYDIAKNTTLDYDAIVVLSGDGLVHEVFNGLTDHENPEMALDIPVIPIPTGSANGFSIALLGIQDGLDPGAAVLNAIKGKKMKIDLCSIQQNNKRSISFLSQTIGLMADIDLGSEPLRWMGDTRFTVGAIWGICRNKGYDVKVEIKASVQDKTEMVKSYKSAKSLTSSTLSSEGGSVDKWITIEKPLAYVYAGKVPYVSRTLKEFPLAMCDDGFIDVVVQEKLSRLTWLTNLDGADQGKHYWMPTLHYYKARAYRLTPGTSKGQCSIDGERFPYAPFEVEVLPRAGTTLGRGSWVVGDFAEEKLRK